MRGVVAGISPGFLGVRCRVAVVKGRPLIAGALMSLHSTYRSIVRKVPLSMKHRLKGAVRSIIGYAPVAQIPLLQNVRNIEGWLMPEEAEGLYELARRFGSVILEIGTYKGKSSTALISGALSKRHWKQPQLFSLDIDPAARILGAETLQLRGLLQYAQFFHGGLSDFRRQFDIIPTMVFVDGDHRYEGVIKDTTELSSFLRAEVPVVFHDYLNRDTPGVAKAVDEWCRNGFARPVRKFGTSALVMTTAKCMQRKSSSADSAFKAA
jgi:hypothetical protein